jgi:tRNA A37 methylthiotransferase MiaB
MFKIFFYHANDSIGYNTDRQIYLGIAALYLKTHIDHNKKHIANKIEWLIPQQEKLSDKDLIDKLNKEKPDIFCTSHYIWNHDHLSKQIERIRPHVSKNILFVAGGPSIDVNIDKNFFQKHPSIDYAMYGAGEAGFADLIESLMEDKKLIKFNTSNIAWYDVEKNKQIVADFKYVPQTKISPYTHNVSLFSSMVKQMLDKNLLVIVPYELTRGCPYKCTFCDWNSGLTNKTTRRKGTYEDEIDLFYDLGIKGIYLADANVGQYEEDIDMVAYLAKKNIEEGAEFRTDGNFSKLRKENNLKIYHLLARGNLITDNAGFIISVQDTNEDVLINIDRPDVGWDVHVKIMKELQEHYPKKPSQVQLIQGLPGQTVESWKQTLKTVASEATFMHIFVSELLSASPAARDENYQDRFKFEYSDAERFNSQEFFKGQFTKSCVSFSQCDYVEMSIWSTFYSGLVYFRSQSTARFDFDAVVRSFAESTAYQKLLSNLQENWLVKNKFFYTIDFNGAPLLENPLSTCHFKSTGINWAHSVKFLQLVANHLTDNISPSDYVKNSLTKKDGKIVVNFELKSHFLDHE